jgi:hypothetical protein
MGLGDMNAFLPSCFQSANSVLWKEKKKKNEENLLRGVVINAGSLTLTDDRLNIVNVMNGKKIRKAKKFLPEKLIWKKE